MNFFRRKVRDVYLENTSVENMFLIDYMPDAEEDFVKVYLTGLMSAGDENASNSRIASHLNMEEERVLQAWNHWEKCGVIRKHYEDPSDRFHYAVEFLSLKEQLYAPELQETDRGEAARNPVLRDADLRDLYLKIESVTGRMLEGKEPETILSWLEEDGLPPDFIIYVYQFCVERRKQAGFRYAAAVLRDWIERGIQSVEAAEKLLNETEQNRVNRRRVMQALGFRRNPTEDEAEKIDSWFEELDCSMETVLKACGKTSGISNPNINYVDKVLRGWNSGEDRNGSQAGGAGAQHTGAGAVQLVMRSYDEARKRHRAEMEEHIREVYQRIPRVKELDDLIRDANVKRGRAAFRGGRVDKKEADRLRQTLDHLLDEKKQLLEQAGYPEDYMEMQYDCKVCEDSGTTRDGVRCACFAEKLQAVTGRQ
ncbi:MAG: DnaD domain protein [Firmicutes bacterium]|nr:DnaD domain protein [Bacillota bacterium]